MCLKGNMVLLTTLYFYPSLTARSPSLGNAIKNVDVSPASWVPIPVPPLRSPVIVHEFWELPALRLLHQ